MTVIPLSVAVPWSLSHYIPLNGFHPLYRSLFDERPAGIMLNAWDNTALSNMLSHKDALREALLKNVVQEHNRHKAAFTSHLAPDYADAFFPPNMALTALLPGDIELHHTAPFPSMSRPFIFHCESFAPIFFPFMQQGGGSLGNAAHLREHYGRIFADPLCLGIFSHIPNTIDGISSFFRSPVIDAKLHQSRIGITPRASASADNIKSSSLQAPKFLFINSANQNPENFIHRGGPVILKFWMKFITVYRDAKLYLRCRRPADDVLANLGIDLEGLHREESRSVIWIQDFIADNELNRLMAHVHFFLLPSASLHSVSIMQAMALGAVPIVSDTIGTDNYVMHGDNGIVLDGVRANNWKPDPETGILVDHYQRNAEVEDRLVQQIETNIIRMIEAPQDYAAVRSRAMECAAARFSGQAFGEAFWSQVRELWGRYSGHKRHDGTAYKSMLPLRDCLVDDKDWPRIFASVRQPMTRIYTGRGKVSELAGAFIYTEGNETAGVHDWCVMAEYYKAGAPSLCYVDSISELGGKYLTATPVSAVDSIVADWSALLSPYPRIHRVASRLWKLARTLMKTAGLRDESDPFYIQLVAENISGMNVIRCRDDYYAIPQDGGAFSEERAKRGGYRMCFKGNSLRNVLGKIAEYDAAEGRCSPHAGVARREPTLVAENVAGFNIVRYANQFIAIPQSEGAFEHQRALTGGYSHMHIGATLDEIKLAITASAS